uniref:Pheophorbide a oxygenase domain-containing protein n=3 Tax=Lotharella globosa TaxID=91324 RepID=A0A6U3AD81_9EUKA|mmetsp:Transcript_22764/g.44385  ORF Transcript_22764/g.44385 Transcript_22764/m.44385 type:complete len:469 (+) Transcript_22764:104-1510(+)
MLPLVPRQRTTHRVTRRIRMLARGFAVALAISCSLALLAGVRERVSAPSGLQAGIRGSNMQGNSVAGARMRSPRTSPEWMKARSELVNPGGLEFPQNDLVGLAGAERDNMINSIQEKMQCAAQSLDKLKGRIAKIAENETKGAGPPIRPMTKSKTFAQQKLYSSLTLEAGLKEHWYPVEFMSKLGVHETRRFEIFDTMWTLTRTGENECKCVSDAGDTLTPSIQDGLIWIYPGEKTPPAVPEDTRPPEGYVVHAELEMEVPVEHGLLMENLLDLAHAPFTHTSTFAKGWSVPDSVKFHASKMLSGSWDPYPIDMAFDIPCMVNSKIGLVQVGKAAINVRANDCENHLHQLHVCIPSGEGKTRLLYRMSLDMKGLEWTRNMPGVNLLWKSIAEQVLSEDTALVVGQQDRMKMGANTWENPVSYDKLGVRYRRWRNSLNSPDEKEREEAVRATKQKLSAGELFAVEEEEA